MGSGLIAGIAALMASALGGSFWYSRRATQQRRVLWERVAADLDGAFFEGNETTFRRETDRVVVKRAGVTATLDTDVVGRRDQTQVFTRVRGQYASGLGPSFKVRPNNFLARSESAKAGLGTPARSR